MKNIIHLTLIPLMLLALLMPKDVTGQSVTTITLPQALDYALENYVDARKARLDQENVKYEMDEVTSRAYPQISASGGLVYNPLLQKSALPGELNPVEPGVPLLVAFGQKWNANLGLNLSQTLFDQALFTGLKAARSSKEFYAINTQLTEEKVIEQVATAYYQVLVQRQQITNLDSTISTTKNTLDIIDGLYKSGLGRKIDVDRLAVQISNLNSQRQQLINAVTQYENLLKFYMGMPVETVILIPDLDANEIDFKNVVLNEETSFLQRTEILLLRKQEELLQYQKQSIKAEYYPSLSLSGNLSLQGLSNEFPIFRGQEKGANWFEVSSIGLNLKVPIFNGNATKSRVRQSEISIKKLQEDIRYTQQGLSLDHANAVTQIQNSIIVLNSQIRNEKLAEEVLDNTNNNYKQGLASLTDLLDAEQALFDARNAYSSSLLEFKLAELKLIKSKGQLRSLLN